MMKQILQSLKTGAVELAEIPVPQVKPGTLLIKTSRSLISLGTERMLLNFGKAGWIDKARQQPDKVRQVLQKIKTDGLAPTVNAVMNKLDQPLAPGYSNAGIVIAVGNGVTGLRPATALFPMATMLKLYVSVPACVQKYLIMLTTPAPVSPSFQLLRCREYAL
jgi:NADPH:quinone reductase-like Zn-dependent oxidoreductase